MNVPMPVSSVNRHRWYRRGLSHTPHPGRKTQWGRLDAKLAIRNASSLPVMGVHIFWETTDNVLPSHPIYEVDVLPPSDQPQVVAVRLIDLNGFAVGMIFD